MLIPSDQIPRPVPDGLFETCAASLRAAGYPSSVVEGPDGVECANADLVLNVFESYAGSPVHLLWLKRGSGDGGLLDKLASFYAQKLAEGRAFQGKTYQIDEASLTKISGMGALAGIVAAGVPGATWPSPFGWIAVDNTVTPMTALEMLAFAQDVAGYVSELVTHNRVLKNAIIAAETIEQLEEIDITAGWPANG